MPIRNRFSELHAEITAWRRDLHMHPELMFETHRTAKFVETKLNEFGCDRVETGIGRTGVVGLIHGRSTDSGRVVGLRADMDALPIHEETGVDYASVIDGAMHACGHDGHTAMLLGAAKYLAETRNFDGTIAVIFQPAEEGGGGGREMCNDGLMDNFNISEVYGMHNWPGHPAGEFSIRPGPFFAATDTFEVTIEGRGGHAAKPETTIDPVVTAAQIVTSLQSIVARNADPTQQIVVSTTSITSSSTAFNVIPQTVTLRGTIRTLDADLRHLAETRFKAIVANIAQAYGATADIDFMRGYPCMVNAETETGYAAMAAKTVASQCDDAPLIMGGEDFAYMLEERPGAYILVGNGDTAMVHHPKYNFNDDIIPSGCSWWVEVAESRLPIG